MSTIKFRAIRKADTITVAKKAPKRDLVKLSAKLRDGNITWQLMQAYCIRNKDANITM